MTDKLKPMHVAEAVLVLACTWILGVCYGMQKTMKAYETRLAAIHRDVDDLGYRCDEAKRIAEELRAIPGR